MCADIAEDVGRTCGGDRSGKISLLFMIPQIILEAATCIFMSREAQQAPGLIHLAHKIGSHRSECYGALEAGAVPVCWGRMM